MIKEIHGVAKGENAQEHITVTDKTAHSLVSINGFTIHLCPDEADFFADQLKASAARIRTRRPQE